MGMFCHKAYLSIFFEIVLGVLKIKWNYIFQVINTV